MTSPVIMQSLSWAKDAAERAVATFLQAAIPAVSTAAVFDLAMWEGAALAGGAAVLSLAKSAFARFMGRTGSASMIG